jgi:tRNA G46 methylase TrmB
MIQFYQVLKARTGYCEFTTDNNLYKAYLFKDSIQNVDIEQTSDIEFERMEFNIPVIMNSEKFEESEKKEGYVIHRIPLSSIRKFEWLKTSKKL